MKRKFLEDLGLEKEKINNIMAEHGKSVESSKKEIEELKNQVSTFNTTIEDLKKNTSNVEELQASLKAKDNEIKTIHIKNKLQKVGYLDLEHGGIKGIVEDIENFDLNTLDDHIKGVQESRPYLFKANEPVKGPTIIANKLTEGNHSNLGTDKVTFESAIKDINKQ